jgi:hypothetical protein
MSDPSEQHGGAPMGEGEIQEKGTWAAKADEGIAPVAAEAPEQEAGDDQELGDEVTGRTTGSDEPATEEGVDLSAGDHADATEQGGSETPDGVEPDLKDIGRSRVRSTSTPRAERGPRYRQPPRGHNGRGVG